MTTLIKPTIVAALIVSLPILVGVFLAGCANEPKVEVVAVAAKVQKPPMALVCRRDTYDKFKLVDKVPGNTDPAALAHALQSNKSRMARNEFRTILCECSIAEDGNEEDKKRLAATCSELGNIKDQLIAMSKTESKK